MLSRESTKFQRNKENLFNILSRLTHNEQGECFAKTETLAKWTHKSKRQIFRYLGALKSEKRIFTRKEFIILGHNNIRSLRFVSVPPVKQFNHEVFQIVKQHHQKSAILNFSKNKEFAPIKIPVKIDTPTETVMSKELIVEKPHQMMTLKESLAKQLQEKIEDPWIQTSEKLADSFGELLEEIKEALNTCPTDEEFDRDYQDWLKKQSEKEHFVKVPLDVEKPNIQLGDQPFPKIMSVDEEIYQIELHRKELLLEVEATEIEYKGNNF